MGGSFIFETGTTVPNKSQKPNNTFYFTYSSPPKPFHFPVRLSRYRQNVTSRPRPVGVTGSKQSHSSPGIRKELKIDNRPHGVHDYFNLMWDPHVVRGSTIKVKAEYVNQSPCNDSSSKTTERSIIHGTKKKFKPNPSSVSNNHLYTKNRQNETRLHQRIQTERFLEELSSDTSSLDAIIQTDKIYNIKPSTLHTEIQIKTGVDAWTQVGPGELFDFDTEVEPVLDTLVTKILEQSLIEVVEEEELLAIREQRNRFEEERKQEEKALLRLQAEKSRITREKEILKKELALERFVPENGTGTLNYASSEYFLEILPSVLNSLKEEARILDEIVTNDNPETIGVNGEEGVSTKS